MSTVYPDDAPESEFGYNYIDKYEFILIYRILKSILFLYFLIEQQTEQSLRSDLSFKFSNRSTRCF